MSEINIPFGLSVTQRINTINQPRGGYLKPKELTAIPLFDESADRIAGLAAKENVHASLVGMAVDYLTRFMRGASAEEVFAISYSGAKKMDMLDKAVLLLTQIKGLDDTSIINAVKLTGFDVCFRARPALYKLIEEINPDADTVNNIRLMVQRSLAFLEKFGPVIKSEFTFKSGYTDIVSSGDGDYLTKDGLWDFKVSKNKIKKEQTLQILIYWRLGLHSVHPEFKQVKYLGLYNPRENIAYRIATADISKDVIKEVEEQVIGY